MCAVGSHLVLVVGTFERRGSLLVSRGGRATSSVARWLEARLGRVASVWERKARAGIYVAPRLGWCSGRQYSAGVCQRGHSDLR